MGAKNEASDVSSKIGKIKILITGAGGFIGGALFSKIKHLNPVGVDFGLKPGQASENLIDLDLRQENKVKALFDKYSPDTVFHFAALTSPKRNEENQALAKESHLDITNNIINHIHKDTHIIFLTTDKIFDGADPYPDEQAKPNPLYIYGYLKLQCELIIQRRLKKFHIFRLPIVHSFGDYVPLSNGAGPISFIDQAIIDINDGKQVTVFDNVQRCFLRRQELVDLFNLVLNDDNYGSYHLGSRMMSYYDRLRFLCEENGIGWEGKLIPVAGHVLPLVQNLNTSKFKKTFGYSFS